MRFIHSILKRRECLGRIKGFYQASSGMTLIEIALVLAILGVLGGLSLPLLSNQLNLKRVHQARENHQRIMTSLAVYLLQHGRLPCPADANQEGVALKRCDRIDQAVGSLPFQTLGLSKDSATDGKRPYGYMVNPPLTRTAQLQGSLSYCEAESGMLQLFDQDQNPVLSGSKDFIAVILIDERYLAELKSTGNFSVSNGHIRVDLKSSTSHLNRSVEHITSWVSRHELIAWYGKFPCPPPKHLH